MRYFGDGAGSGAGRAGALVGRCSTHRGGAIRAGHHPGGRGAAPRDRQRQRHRNGRAPAAVAAARRDTCTSAGTRQADDGARPPWRRALVLAADLRAADWRLALAGIDGIPQVVAQAGCAGEDLDVVLSQLAAAIGTVYRRKAQRLRAIAISVAGTISGAKLVQFTSRGWHDVDLSVLTTKIRSCGRPPATRKRRHPVGLAEARTGAARSAATALHLIVAEGIGGTLVVKGEPLAGAQGAAGSTATFRSATQRSSARAARAAAGISPSTDAHWRAIAAIPRPTTQWAMSTTFWPASGTPRHSAHSTRWRHPWAAASAAW